VLPPSLHQPWQDLYRAFASVPKPTKVDGCPCCIEEERIVALVNSDREHLPESDDLLHYVSYALGTVGGPADLTYLFPAVTRVWAEKLWEGNRHDAYRERFWELNTRHGYFDAHLTPALRDAVEKFLRTALMAALGREGPLQRIKGLQSAHLWAEELTSFAQVCQTLPDLWREWWSIPSSGHAVSAFQFASCFAFAPENNPVFHKWTPLGGGGPPWTFTEVGRAWRSWSDANLAFLRRTLNAARLADELSHALEKLQSDQERTLAGQVLEGVRGDPQGVDERIRLLVES
jgi:hypothetical protein